jgi:exonuclease III
MPRYFKIKDYESKTRKRTLERILDLRKVLTEKVPSTKPDSLLLATWNIRDFDSNFYKQGPRLDESFNYIAEIISRFDLVAMQEINRDLDPLRKLVWLLGNDWDFLVTSITEGQSGNGERMAFLFNKKRVNFTNLAGQVILPKSELLTEEGLQFARAPYVVSFQAGWFKFNICTVHIYFGEDSGEKLQRRINEIKKIAVHFKNLNKKETGDYILLGDFNIVSPQHQTMEALEKNGFKIPDILKGFETNLSKNKFYDQIAFKQNDKRLEFGEAGIFDFRDAVFREQDYDDYFEYMKPEYRDFNFRGRGANKNAPRTEEQKRNYYNKEWITWQMSDHLLLWVELKVDFTNDYLKSLMPGEEPLADL